MTTFSTLRYLVVGAALLLGGAVSTASAQDVPTDSAPAFCDDLTELNSVYFIARSEALDGAARGRLAENIVLLQQRQSVTVSVSAWTERCEDDGDPFEVAARRAAAVRDHYLDAGIAPDRIEWCIGGGEDAGSCGKTPQERTPRGRRADTVPLTAFLRSQLRRVYEGRVDASCFQPADARR